MEREGVDLQVRETHLFVEPPERPDEILDCESFLPEARWQPGFDIYVIDSCQDVYMQPNYLVPILLHDDAAFRREEYVIAIIVGADSYIKLLVVRYEGFNQKMRQPSGNAPYSHL